MATSAIAPTIFFAADGCVMAHWRGIGIVLWGTQATPALVEQLGRLAEEVVRTHARGSLVSVVLRGTLPPTTDARAVIRLLAKRWASQLICSATLIEQGGFWASAFRSLLTGLDLLTGRSIRLKAFDDIQALAEWVAPQHAANSNLTMESADLVQVLNALRAHDALGRLQP